jgi:cytochrome P450
MTDLPILEGFDPLSQAFLADPLPSLERARTERPVLYVEELGIWAITRYDDVARAYADFTTFSSALRNAPAIPERYADEVPADFFPPIFMDRDPPEHTAIRKAANRIFRRPRIAAMEAHVQAIVDELVDAFADDGACDLVQQLTYPLSARASMALIGIPEADLPRFEQLAEDLVAILPYQPGVPGQTISEAQWLERWERIVEARGYFRAMVQARVAEPQDDVASAFVHARDGDGQPIMSVEDTVSYMLLMIFAGTDTTASYIGLLVKLLCEHPDQLEAALADPAVMANAVEEGLRRRASSLGSMRLVTRDVEVAGQTIPAGAQVWLVSTSASNDEQRFACPAHFDVHRENAGEHLAFGRGRHFCMGAPLARLEAPLAVRTLWTRLPGFRLAPGQTLRYDPVFVTLLYNHLHVEWDAA